ncbi:hypothetical protein GBZ48_35155 [Azospirillum melinis]|uniref:Uncharacterized protein n=1 Tax=Azospirillum melinis TaxID=328839 RepID=A0ABX2KSE8_9PROT|nr:hypothetical protein [Azospirillum melinis]
MLTAYLAASAVAADNEAADRDLGGLEAMLSAGAISSPADLHAKARYIQHCHRLDPALVPRDAIDTLVAGIGTLFGSALTGPAPASSPR